MTNEKARQLHQQKKARMARRARERRLRRSLRDSAAKATKAAFNILLREQQEKETSNDKQRSS